MPDKRVDYVLTTGANWRSPIGTFRHVVDKGKAGNLVSFLREWSEEIARRNMKWGTANGGRHATSMC